MMDPKNEIGLSRIDGESDYAYLDRGRRVLHSQQMNDDARRSSKTARDATPSISTYLLGIGIAVAVLWPVIVGFIGLIKNGVYGLTAGFPLAFLLPSIGTSPLRGFLGITTAAVIIGSLPLLLALLIGPARAPKFRAVLWVLAVLLVAFVVLLGTISWNTFVRAGV